MTRYGGDCYLFAALALGFVDLVIEAGFQAWDVGGADSAGRRRGRHDHRLEWRFLRLGKTILAAGDKRVHAAAMKLLAG